MIRSLASSTEVSRQLGSSLGASQQGKVGEQDRLTLANGPWIQPEDHQMGSVLAENWRADTNLMES